MPRLTEQQLNDKSEMIGRLCNTRFGFERSLSIVLSRFLNQDEIKLAVKAAKNRDFETFEYITQKVKPSKKSKSESLKALKKSPQRRLPFKSSSIHTR